MEILAIIPARGGSKGVPRKNIRPLNGKPLIAYTIEEAKKSKYISRVIVSTEDQEIADISKTYGADIPFMRPLELASDLSPSFDTIIHAINWLSENEGYKPEYICLLQCTTPLKRVDDIDGIIKKLLSTGMDGAITVCESESHPYWMQTFDGDRMQNFVSQELQVLRRQDLPSVYKLNGVAWVVKTAALLSEKSLMVKNRTGYVMGALESVDIDTDMDFKYAEMLIKEREIHASNDNC